jgi:poly-gamma-glutamate synthesis protein (capsule biosynthesis protein)
VTQRPLRLILAGDAMLGRGVDEVIAARGPDHPLAALRPCLADADLVGVNLECAITARDSRYAGPPKAFYFRARPAAVEVLRHAGVGLCTLANNHALDAGADGLLDTLRLLDAHGIAHAGAGADLAAARAPAVLDLGGQRRGVLACCDHQADFAASATQAGIDYLDLADPLRVEALVQRVRELAAQVDHAVVSLHWQPNWVPAVSADYRALARRLVAAGARLVWGHSPHHFLGVEWLGQAVVLYSSGGLLDDYAVEPYFRNDRQLLFEITLGAGAVSRVRALPLALGFAHTAPAEGQTRQWIVDRLAAQCRAHGSAVGNNGDWLTLSPAPHDHP